MTHSRLAACRAHNALPGLDSHPSALRAMVRCHRRNRSWHNQEVPLGRIQQALDAAEAGDVVSDRTRYLPGIHPHCAERRARAHQSTIRASGGLGSVVVSVAGRVLTVAHASLVVDGLVLDGRPTWQTSTESA